MRISETWLKEWVDTHLPIQALVERLTMAGFEVDEVIPIDEDGQCVDQILVMDVTPNRGDCLSMKGMARELAAILDLDCQVMEIPHATVTTERDFPVQISDGAACPRYVGRVIENITTCETPQWMKKRLSAGGVESISFLVDVANYVMLELGQPLHTFDLSQLQTHLVVRYAQQNETLTLLDGKEKTLSSNTLVIADEKGPVAIAGIMGGERTAVRGSTTRIFLESAFFNPAVIAGRARQYGLKTEASHRYERGVDPNLPLLAIERATTLILSIAGGMAGPVFHYAEETWLKSNVMTRTIRFRQERLQKVLGFFIPEALVMQIFHRLGLRAGKQGGLGEEIMIPSHRFDLHQEEDLIEEVIRLYGYEKMPVISPMVQMQAKPVMPQRNLLQTARSLLVDRGYHEAITYSFVDPRLQRFFDETAGPRLLNPLSSELSEMRTTLWPGLLAALSYNLTRQCKRVRLFETGLCYRNLSNHIDQSPQIGGVVSGEIMPLQWGATAKITDFFDVKNDLLALIKIFRQDQSLTFHPAHRSGLHPGQTAVIRKDEQDIGWLGALHPDVSKYLDITQDVFVFELSLTALKNDSLPIFTAIPKLNPVRRDISFLIDRACTAADILLAIRSANISSLSEITLFDVYQGKGLTMNQKSMAIALFLDQPVYTLQESEITAAVNAVIQVLQSKFHIALRE